MSSFIEETGQTGSTNVRSKRRLLRFIVLLLVILDFGSFAIWGFQEQFNPNGTFIFAEKERKEELTFWPSFVWEADFHKKLGIKNSDLVLDYYVKVRKKIGFVADYFALKLLRINGIVISIGLGLILLAFFVIEGLRERERKRQEFENLSSTWYHISLRSCVGLFTGVLSIYVFLPNGHTLSKYLPGLFPAFSFWVVDPVIWSAFIVISMAGFIYMIFSNLAKGI